MRYSGAQETAHGSAEFASDRRIGATLLKPDGLIVGRENRREGRLLRHDGAGHLLTIAPTRSGKGVGAIIPNLLATDRSILCVDSMGENARVSLEARGRLGPVHVLDPFGVTGAAQARYNPMTLREPQGQDLAEDAAVLADALVYDPPAHLPRTSICRMRTPVAPSETTDTSRNCSRDASSGRRPVLAIYST